MKDLVKISIIGDLHKERLRLREKIVNKLKKIEDQFEVRICYAVESGSRAWGFFSRNSDYDVRFIYVHKMEWYLSIDEKRDVIELPINELLDINGWELRKALKLYRKSNPAIMEWLQSGIVYDQSYSLVEKMKAIHNEVFLPKSALYHYFQMANGNYRDFLQKGWANIKKYLNILRPILACCWILRYHSFPPIEFKVLAEALLESGFLKREILALIAKKMNGIELSAEMNIPVINDFISQELARIQTCMNSLTEIKREDITPALDKLFRETLHEVWT